MLSFFLDMIQLFVDRDTLESAKIDQAISNILIYICRFDQLQDWAKKR